MAHLSKRSRRAAFSSSFLSMAAWHSARRLLVRLSFSPTSACAACQDTGGWGHTRLQKRVPGAAESPERSPPGLAGSLLTGGPSVCF